VKCLYTKYICKIHIVHMDKGNIFSSERIIWGYFDTLGTGLKKIRDSSYTLWSFLFLSICLYIYFGVWVTDFYHTVAPSNNMCTQTILWLSFIYIWFINCFLFNMKVDIYHMYIIMINIGIIIESIYRKWRYVLKLLKNIYFFEPKVYIGYKNVPKNVSKVYEEILFFFIPVTKYRYVLKVYTRSKKCSQ